MREKRSDDPRLYVRIPPAMSRATPPAADFVGPSGNATRKYESGNPLVRVLVSRFLTEIESTISAVRPHSILDAGCGEGLVTERLAPAAAGHVVGVDLGDDLLRDHWRRRERDRLSFQAASIYALPFDDASFDCVCALEVLEHLERPRDALRELCRVAQRTLLVSVPREPIWRAVHLLAGRDVRHLGNTPGHINHWSSRRFARLVAEFARVERVSRPFPWTVVLASPREGAAR
jgi:SAM-dependent methyltransferase